MTQENILSVYEILDDFGSIRPEFMPRVGSGWIPHGRYFGINEDGRIVLEINYYRGLVHGAYLDYWPNGKVACEGQFHNGHQHGCWHFYNLDGSLSEIVRFQEGKEVILAENRICLPDADAGVGDSSDT
jgi:hypothetical protein